MPENNDTIVAVATPLGRGGIGVVRVSGKKSKAIYIALTGQVPIPRQAQYVSFKSSQQIIDKGIALYFEAPASYSGEEVIECHVHGSRVLLEMLVDEIVSLGARIANPGEFTERAFLNGKIDLVQAEAVADLIDCNSKKAARSALQSLDGVFSSKVKQLREEVFTARSLIEAALDFPDEEDVDIDIHPAIEKIEKCLTELTIILRNAEAGRILDHNPTVVIAGLPNAGKSCLINFLCGYDSAIVSAEAGTTRDIIREKVLLGDFAVTLIDTAGLRETNNAIEKEGVDRSYKALSVADIVLYVVDNSLNEKAGAEIPDKHISAGAKKIIVRNKIDLCKNNAFKNTDNEVFVSVKTGAGMGNLLEKISAVLDITDNDEDIIFARQRHIDALNSVKDNLKQVLIAEEKGLGLEVLAESMRLALSGFDEITGRTTTDDVLGKVFSQFCIGK
ncbi:MAG: tRNA uridine-5-carboxymethylaminomethyl(34) synthesis GTPase MnmE [Proteobacteria bacterium]|nr:tRNA uridine-5-carboxymethylaminomethyl(34) synthesis GTPase MnmE [Pseudomonadota bacterium]NOG60703.1 tRNA uridine-5-carboxymethylaminomethyl(34) synthesis GTPase MnmE [Pseudomonadota bacterium]